VESADLQTQIERALERFGTTVLTRREAQLVRCLLHGKSCKEIAQELGISYQTARVHRRHAYRKLGVSTHAALFRSFIDSLSAAA